MASNSVAPVVEKALKCLENQIDNEIDKFDSLTDDGLQEIRLKRLEEMKTDAKNKREWISKGHGEYAEIAERDFFDVVKKSQRAVIHFFTNSSTRRHIFDKHLKLLAMKHLETRFVQLNAEKSPFLTEKLNVKVIPTLLMVKDTQVVHKMIGFTELGNCDNFSTEVLEWRLGCCGIIDYKDDVRQPPENLKMDHIARKSGIRKTIRGPIVDDDNSDLEI